MLPGLMGWDPTPLYFANHISLVEGACVDIDQCEAAASERAPRRWSSTEASSPHSASHHQVKPSEIATSLPSGLNVGPSTSFV